jgi:hypothetical protein
MIKKIRGETGFCTCGTRLQRHYINPNVPEYFLRKSKQVCPYCYSEFEDKEEK